MSVNGFCRQGPHEEGFTNPPLLICESFFFLIHILFMRIFFFFCFDTTRRPKLTNLQDEAEQREIEQELCRLEMHMRVNSYKDSNIHKVTKTETSRSIRTAHGNAAGSSLTLPVRRLSPELNKAGM